MKSAAARAILFVGLLAGIGVGAYLWVFRLAPMPPIFDESVTLTQASDRAGAEQHVVLAVVTADFCPVCQAYKRGALSDPQVAEWARANAETVYLEWERDAATIESLGIEKWPATLVLDAEGNVLAQRYGRMDAIELISFANSAIPAAGDSGAASNADDAMNPAGSGG